MARPAAFFGHSPVRARVIGADFVEQGLVRQVLRGLRPSAVRTVRFGAPPRSVRGGGRWVYVLAERSDRPANLRTRWEALLAIGAFRDLELKAGVEPLAGYVIRTVNSRADDDPRPVPVGVLKRPQRGVARPGGLVPSLVTQTRGVLRLRSATLLRPLGPAALVRAGMSEPRRYLEAFSRLSQGELARPTGDGVFVEITGPSGRVLMRYGYASRLGRTVGWVAPSLLRTS